MIIGSAPVRDDDPVKSPLLSQDIPEQVGIFIGIDPVDLVITGHDRFGAALFHSDLEPGQIDLTERALVHDRVHGHPPKLLAVHREMLRAGVYSLALDPPNISCRHLSGKAGIF